MKTIKLDNGITINVSDAEYKNYTAQQKALKELEKNSNKLNAETKTKSVSATYSDYVTRALSKGMELLYLADSVSVVAKGNVCVVENRGFSKPMYAGIKYTITELFGGKWCGDHDKQVFTYRFADLKHGLAYIYFQKNAKFGGKTEDEKAKNKAYNSELKTKLDEVMDKKFATLKDLEKLMK